ALSMYSGDNRDYFPDNTGGHDLSWMSPGMSNFYKNYLYPNHRGNTTHLRTYNDVLYCPTDEWHRIAETTVTDDSNPQLIGYFYLPYRVNNANDGWDYNSCGIGGWHFRTRFGGQFRLAPTMSDRLQALGSWSVAANSGSVTWSTTFSGRVYPTASHRE